MLRAFAAALEQPEDVFAPIYTPEAHQLLKIIRYPGRSGGDRPGRRRAQGFGLRHDPAAGQAGRSAGAGRERGWIDAPPVEGSFVVNIGEILEMASNGYLQAPTCIAWCRRRKASTGCRSPSSSARGSTRRSRCSTSRRDLAAQAGGVTQDPLNPLFREVGRNYLKSRLRSHPDVARRHHADLLDCAA